MLEEAKDIVTETAKDIQEVVKERFYSPMYFYFFIAWVITNWKFVFALLFIDSDDIYGEKLDYLINFYPLEGFWLSVWTISKLVLIPALSSYIFVWWFSLLAEKFFKRNAEFRLNKLAIKRTLEYDAKRKERTEEIEIRELEVGEQVVKLADNPEFNDNYDSLNEIVELSGTAFRPSELLYSTDYDLYIETLNEFLNNPITVDHG
ncbi:hypothetical protein LY01_02870 [Nonlabens xylanidelens]|uniref:Uncharacterized protein n=1 Tax=Nonlabens xylanidelens TaxID=191564 RepID=A0A2S6IEY6_9FLAO|nr:hypothetical protein [Nonlabens xylanidelens]PPK92784.1 hypothetical protein LY01_02870 [Nonlabens xylanidelens]PQJ19828.1 hypothetical protein BST94_06185 [Nonlabens xylanidelens]